VPIDPNQPYQPPTDSTPSKSATALLTANFHEGDRGEGVGVE